MVGLAVTAGIEPVTGDSSRGRGDRRGSAQVRPGGLGAQPPGVVPGSDQQHGGGAGAGAVELEQSGGVGGHERMISMSSRPGLAVQELGTAAELTQGQQGVPADHAARAGPQRGQPGDQPGWRMAG